MNSDEEFSIEMPTPEEATGSNALSVSWPEVDASELMATYTIEFEDYDGYTIRETCQLSPIFRHEDREIMYGLWEALGEDAGYFPMEEDFYDANHNLRNVRDGGYNELEYIIGTFMVENLTDGYPITPDNPRGYSGVLMAGNKVGSTGLFNTDSVSVVFYSDRSVYYGEDNLFEVKIGDAKMTADTWGPRPFVIAIPNKFTPNEPDGYRYDEQEMRFGYPEHITFNLSYYE